jgi:amino acid adenylation domain-containing protein
MMKGRPAQKHHHSYRIGHVPASGDVIPVRFFGNEADANAQPDTDHRPPDSNDEIMKKGPWIPTPVQKCMFHRGILCPEEGFFIQQLTWTMDGAWRHDLFREALRMVAARHDILRSFFVSDDGGDPLLFIDPSISIDLDVRIQHEVSETDRKSVLARFLSEDRARGFDFSSSPLWRVTVFLWKNRPADCIWTYHHIILDGRSHLLVLREILQHYAQLIAGQPGSIKPAQSFTKYLKWLQDLPDQQAREYWKDRLKDFKSGTKLPGIPDPTENMAREDSSALERIELDKSETDSLRSAARRHGVSLNNLIQAGWALELGRQSATSDVVFGVVRACRHWPGEETRDAVGMFMNIVPFRVDTSPQQKVGDWLRELKEQQEAARDGEYASPELIKDSADIAPASRLFHSILMFEGFDWREEMLQSGRNWILHEKTDIQDLMAYAGDQLTLVFDCSPGKHTHDQAMLVLLRLRAILSALADAAEDSLIGDLGLFGDEDQKKVFNPSNDNSLFPTSEKSSLPLSNKESNRTETHFPRELSVVELIRMQATQRPEATALDDGRESLSYDELERLSNRVANGLLRGGLQSEEIVALLMNRSCRFAVAALGVLKAGGSYLPIDTANPNQRLDYLLADSRARFIIAEQDQIKRCTGRIAFPATPEWESFAGEMEALSLPASDPSRRAYVIYTSGSTGEAKGVEIEHHSLSNLVSFYHRHLQLTTEDRMTMIANVAFDASVADLWPGLCAGATVMIPPPELISDLDGLIGWMAEKRVTFSFVPTALAELMFERTWPSGIALRYLATGGDTLRTTPGRELPFTLLNTYGPTENTVDATWSVVPPEPEGKRPSIGKPISNVRAYVLDEELKPVPRGQTGELYLAGEQVARGYLNRPELTMERFLKDPFSQNPGERMYRTGDWVLWNREGEMEFMGRRDDQVQIHGVRIELGEIEQALQGHESVRRSCCRPTIVEGRTSGIVAHLVLTKAQEGFREEIRSYLLEKLPAAAIPGTFVFHDVFPMTPQGKVDRAALDAKTHAAHNQTSSATKLENTKADTREESLTRLWHTLLPNAAGAHPGATFTELGGDSLLALKLLLGVEKIIGRRLPLSALLLDPTLSGLCRTASSSESKKPADVVPMNPHGNRPPVFCLYNLGGDVGVYVELAKALGSDQPVYGIRSPALNNPRATPHALEEAATQVVKLIKSLGMKTPPALVGYSWAGLLAFEVARQWIEPGKEVPFVGLIGAGAPLVRVTILTRVLHFLRWAPHWFHQLIHDGVHWRKRLEEASKRLLKNPTIQINPTVPGWASSPLAQNQVKIGHRYQPRLSEPLLIDLFRERGSFSRRAHPLHPHFTEHETDGGWSKWALRQPRIHWIDGDHEKIYRQPAVNTLAARLRRAMDHHYGYISHEAPAGA